MVATYFTDNHPNCRFGFGDNGVFIIALGFLSTVGTVCRKRYIGCSDGLYTTPKFVLVGVTVAGQSKFPNELYSKHNRNGSYFVVEHLFNNNDSHKFWDVIPCEFVCSSYIKVTFLNLTFLHSRI